MKTSDIIKNLVYVTITVVSALTLVNCKRYKPQHDEIERILNDTHSIIWKCSAECPVGSGYSVLCGTSVPFSVSLECVPCVEGFNFSNTHDYSPCKTCMNCDNHELKSGHCTTEKDTTTCLRTCEKGFYWDDLTDSCQQCSVCCEGQNITDHEKQCESSGLPPTHQCRQTSIICKHLSNSSQNTTDNKKPAVHQGHPQRQTLSSFLIGVIVVSIVLAVVILVVLVLVVMWRCFGCQRAKTILLAAACFCYCCCHSANMTGGNIMYFNHNENDAECSVRIANENEEASDKIGSLKSVAAAPPVGKRPLFKTQLSVPVDFHPKVTPEIHRSKSHPGVLKDLNKEQVPENKPNVQAKIRAKDGRRKKCGKKQYMPVPTTCASPELPSFTDQGQGAKSVPFFVSVPTTCASPELPSFTDQGQGAKSVPIFVTTNSDSEIPAFTPDQVPCAKNTATADFIDLGPGAEMEEKQRLLAPCTLDAKEDQSTSTTRLHRLSNISLSSVPQDFQRRYLQKKMLDIRIEFYGKICNKLDVFRDQYWDDYRLLGEKVGLSKDEVSLLGQKRNTTDLIIQKFNSQRNSSVGKFRKFLEEMERSDVVTIINEWIIDEWKCGM